jgi:hypothetical protein
MMTTLQILAALLMLQQPAPAPESGTERLSERRSSIYVRTLLPAGAGGSASHQEPGNPPVDLDFPISRAEPSVNVSVALDLGPFNGPTHVFLTLELNRIGFATQEPGAGSKPQRGDKGEWRTIELLAGVDWLSEEGVRVGGGLSFGVQSIAYTLVNPSSNDADVSANAASYGLQFYVEKPLGSGFRIGSELRAAFVTNGGTNVGVDMSGEKSRGHTLFFTAWVAWEPVRGLSLRAGYALWSGQFDHEETPLFSSSTATDKLDLRTHGPLLGIEWAF